MPAIASVSKDEHNRQQQKSNSNGSHRAEFNYVQDPSEYPMENARMEQLWLVAVNIP